MRRRIRHGIHQFVTSRLICLADMKVLFGLPCGEFVLHVAGEKRSLDTSYVGGHSCSWKFQ